MVSEEERRHQKEKLVEMSEPKDAGIESPSNLKGSQLFYGFRNVRNKDGIIPNKQLKEVHFMVYVLGDHDYFHNKNQRKKIDQFL